MTWQRAAPVKQAVVGTDRWNDGIPFGPEPVLPPDPKLDRVAVPELEWDDFNAPEVS